MLKHVWIGEKIAIGYREVEKAENIQKFRPQ